MTLNNNIFSSNKYYCFNNNDTPFDQDELCTTISDGGSVFGDVSSSDDKGINDYDSQDYSKNNWKGNNVGILNSAIIIILNDIILLSVWIIF